MMQAISFAAVARMLGIQERPRTAQRRHVDELVMHHGFPPPLPGAGNRTALRCWDERAVNAWFDARLDDWAMERTTRAEIQLAANTLDARAARFAWEQGE